MFTPDIFDHIENTKPGKGGEIQLTDALAKLNVIYGSIFDGKTYDIGNRLEWLMTSIEFALDDEDAHDQIYNYMKSIVDSQ